MKIKKFSPSGKRPDTGDDNNKKAGRDADKVNRTVYLTVATLLIVLAVAVALTSAANRARRGAVAGDDTTASPDTSASAPVTTSPAPEQTATPPAETSAPESSDKPVADVVPTFVLPLDGKLGASHDPTAQVFSDTMKDWRVHLGIDIEGKVGDPVYAAADGRVTKIWDDPLYGRSLTIGHTGKAVTVYQNLGETLADGIEVGCEVCAGQLLGSVGDGALIELAEEPHLHFEVKLDDVSVNPLDYLSKSALKTLEDDTAFEH